VAAAQAVGEGVEEEEGEMKWIDFLSLWGVKLIGLGAILLLIIWIWECVLDWGTRMFDMQWSFIQWYMEKRRKVIKPKYRETP
jgi:hypothetical protein